MANYELISVGDKGQQGDDDTYRGMSSNDGTVILFNTGADNLNSGEISPYEGWYVRDLKTNTTKPIAVSFDPTASHSDLYDMKLSGDGNYVTFRTTGIDPYKTIADRYADIFIYDINNQTTTKISPNLVGVYEIGGSGFPTISKDGSIVVYTTSIGYIPEGESTYLNASLVTMIYNTKTKVTELLSPIDLNRSSNNNTTGSGIEPQISDDGKYVLFLSGAQDVYTAAGQIPPGRATSKTSVFLYDTENKTTKFITDHFTEGTGRVLLSGDGNSVLYSRYSSINSLYYKSEIVLYNVKEKTETIIDSGETLARNLSGLFEYSISDDGKQIAFISNFNPDGNNVTHNFKWLYVYDVDSKQTKLVTTQELDGVSSSLLVTGPFISGDGTKVGFGAHDNAKILTNDINNEFDVFLTDNPFMAEQIANAEAVKTLFSTQSETAQALSAAYEFLLGGIPNEAGFKFLIDGAVSTNFGAGAGVIFNQENKFINLVNNLISGNPTAKSKFDAVATGTTLETKVTSLYKAVIPTSKQTDDGLAFITRPDGLKFYQDVAAQRGVEGTDGAAVIALASLLQIAVNGDFGIGNSVNDLLKAIVAGSSEIPASGSILTPLETADGTAFDTDEASTSRLSYEAPTADDEVPLIQTVGITDDPFAVV